MKLLLANDKLYRHEGDVLWSSVGYCEFFLPLAAHGYRLSVLGRRAPPDVATPHRIAALEFEGLPYFASQADYVRRLAGRRFRRELHRAIDAAVARADLVFLTLGSAYAGAVARAARRRAIPLVLELIDDAPGAVRHSDKRRGWRRLVALAGAELIDASYRRLSRRTPTLVLGAHLERRHARRRQAPLERFLESLLETGDFRFERPRFRGAPLRLLYVGRLVAMKSLETLVEAVARLVEAGVAVDCRIVGEGEDGRRLRERVAVAGLGASIDFTGATADRTALFAHYDWCDVFVLPSIGGEGVPRVLLEALGRGATVVATDVCGIPDVIEHGRRGLLVPPRDPVAIADAVLAFRDDVVLRARCLEEARRYCLGHTRTRQIERLAAFLDTHG